MAESKKYPVDYTVPTAQSLVDIISDPESLLKFVSTHLSIDFSTADAILQQVYVGNAEPQSGDRKTVWINPLEQGAFYVLVGGSYVKFTRLPVKGILLHTGDFTPDGWRVLSSAESADLPKHKGYNWIIQG